MITVFDTETTGLLRAEGNSLAAQPHMIEIYAAQFDIDGDRWDLDDLAKGDDRLVAEFHSYIRPPVSIPEHLTKHVHHISDEMVASAPTFGQVYQQIADVFFGSHTVIGANITFDMGILINELKRIDKEHHFPYPPIWYCTIEQSMHLKGYRLKNSELYKIATGEELVNAHQAKDDTLATFANYKYLKGIK